MLQIKNHKNLHQKSHFHFFFILTSFFFPFWFCSFMMNSFAFFCSSSIDSHLSYSSLSSKSSKLNIPPCTGAGFKGAEIMFEFDNYLNVLMTCVALCSITAKNTKKFVYEIVFDPPISFTTSRSHSIDSKMRSIRVERTLAYFC